MRLAKEVTIGCTVHEAIPGEPCRWRTVVMPDGRRVDVRWYCAARANAVGKPRKSGPSGAARRRKAQG
jgi:hypothetical protein